MIFEDPRERKARIEALTNRTVGLDLAVFEDTSSYMAILGGSILRLAGNDYFVLGDTHEGRFGIDDQPKTWVKYAVDLTTGAQKIIKLVFFEEFETQLGLVRVKCRRSPEKESAILEMVRGDPRFMQGHTVLDPAGNRVRVIDFIRGKSLYHRLEALEQDHEAYYHETLPGLLPEVIACVEGLVRLHERGQHHGDVRNDHLLYDVEAGYYRWIDFDYHVNYADYDLWGVGNIIAFVVGKGIHTFRGVRADPDRYPHLRGPLSEEDACLLAGYRVANLRKLFPYIDPDLNDVLLRFSEGAELFYESLTDQVADLRRVLRVMTG